MEQTYVISLGNLVPISRDGDKFKTVQTKCFAALQKKVPQLQLQAMVKLRLRLRPPRLDMKEHQLLFDDNKSSNIADLIKAHLPVTVDESPCKFQVGPLPKSLSQDELDALVKAAFPSCSDVNARLRLNHLGMSMGCAWITCPRWFKSKLFQWEFISDENKRANEYRLHYRQFIPPAKLYCTKCWNVGHITSACTNAPRCGQCALPGHRIIECDKPKVACLFCSGDDHPTHRCPAAAWKMIQASPAPPSGPRAVSSSQPASQASTGPSYAAAVGRDSKASDHSSKLDEVLAIVKISLEKSSSIEATLASSLTSVFEKLQLMTDRIAHLEAKNAALESKSASLESAVLASQSSVNPNPLRRRRSQGSLPVSALPHSSVSPTNSPPPKKSRAEMISDEEMIPETPSQPVSPLPSTSMQLSLPSSPAAASVSAIPVSRANSQGTRQQSAAVKLGSSKKLVYGNQPLASSSTKRKNDS